MTEKGKGSAVSAHSPDFPGGCRGDGAGGTTKQCEMLAEVPQWGDGYSGEGGEGGGDGGSDSDGVGVHDDGGEGSDGGGDGDRRTSDGVMAAGMMSNAGSG